VTALDLFAVGSWTIFDHLIRVRRLPEDGETLPIDAPEGGTPTAQFGDCSANVAAAAAALGLSTGLGMVVGDDFVSSGYERHLTSLGVDLSGVEVRPGAASGHSYNIFDHANHGFCLSDLGVARDQAGWTPPLAEAGRARAVVACEMFSGYTLACLEHARERGALTAINGMVASAGPLTGRFLAACDVLFLSRSEASDLQDALGAASIPEVLGFGPRTVVVTRGSEGSVWYSAGAETAVPAFPAGRFVDSTGAGDSFVAGSLFGLLAGFDAAAAGRVGACVASFVVAAWGCQTNLPALPALRERYEAHIGQEAPF